MAETIEVDMIVEAIAKGFDKLGGQLDGTAKAQERLEKSTHTTGLSMTKFKGGINDVVQGLTGFSLSTLGVVGGIVAIGKGLQDAVNDTVDYAKSVRDLSRNLGTSTEETSRLIQVADDYQISIGSIETAMKMALKNGFQPTIANLADLADKYVEIQSPTERAAMLTEIFGRNWAELTPLLENGGDALRENADAISKNLILTEESVKAARDYEIAADNMGDSVMALKVSIGNALIPTLTKLADETNNLIGGAMAYSDALENTTLSTKEVNEITELSRQGMITQEEAIKRLTATTEVHVSRVEEMKLAQYAAATASDELTGELSELNDGIVSVSEVTSKFTTGAHTVLSAGVGDSDTLTLQWGSNGAAPSTGDPEWEGTYTLISANVQMTGGRAVINATWIPTAGAVSDPAWGTVT